MDVSAAVKRCPFLHNIAQKHGEDYASTFAAKAGAVPGHKSVLAEDSDFSSTFALFHGRGGVLPLPHLSRPEPKVLYPIESAPPAVKAPELPRPVCPFASVGPISPPPSAPMPLLAAAPLASMSMSWGSNWFNIHHLFQQHFKQHRAQQRRPPQQPQQQPNSRLGGASGPGPVGPGSSGSMGASVGDTGGKCPLRKALGPLAGVVFNKHGHLSCPEPIIKMRAALAATRPVRELRPQALSVKLMTVALTTAVLNVPCGMWREHTEKFSSQWFIAVHATIPFIAMLRKAVIMPKYAIIFTICAAIAGQAMGARLERKRLVAQARNELGGLARAVPRPHGPAVASLTGSMPASSGRQAVAAPPVASMSLTAQFLDLAALGGGGGAGAATGVMTAPDWAGSGTGTAGPVVLDLGSGGLAGSPAGQDASLASSPRGAGAASCGWQPGSQPKGQVAQFRVHMKSGRRLGSRRDAVPALFVGRGLAGAAGAGAGGGAGSEVAGARGVLVPAISC